MPCRWPYGRARPARATLLLYTDGLVERRRLPLSTGIQRAGDAVREGRDLPVEDLAGAVMARLAPAGGYDDDVALLLYRHPAPLDITFPAESSQLAPVRKALRSWLARCELPPNAVQNVLVAVGEACANAIEHSGTGPDGEITVEAQRDGRALNGDEAGGLTLRIHDRGHWPARAAAGDRGRGIPLMRAVMDRVEFETGPDGTTVTMRRGLQDPVS